MGWGDGTDLVGQWFLFPCPCQGRFCPPGDSVWRVLFVITGGGVLLASIRQVPELLLPPSCRAQDSPAAEDHRPECH